MRRASIGSLLAIAICSIALGQVAPRPTEPAVRRPAVAPATTAEPANLATAARAGSVNQEIAALLYGCCHNEVQIAKFAQAKLTNEEARKYAELMVSDHTPSCEAYQRLAGNLAATHSEATIGGRVRVEETREGVAPPREGATAPREGAAPPREGVGARIGVSGAPGAEPRVNVDVQAGTARSGGADWVTIHKQLGAQCLTTTKKELGAKSGAEFDQCFMHLQVMTHLKAIDELTVLRTHATGELRQQIDKDLTDETGHLEMARKIAEKLDDSPARVTRKPSE
jgi:predicted outer membrane protein